MRSWKVVDLVVEDDGSGEPDDVDLELVRVEGDLCKMAVVSKFTKGGLAITTIDEGKTWAVTHMRSGTAVIEKKGSPRQFRWLLNNILPLADWTKTAQEIAEDKGIERKVKDVVRNDPYLFREPVRNRFSLGTLGKILTRPEWEGATVEGPMPHRFEPLSRLVFTPDQIKKYPSKTVPAYKISKGTAVIWLKTSEVEDSIER